MDFGSFLRRKEAEGGGFRAPPFPDNSRLPDDHFSHHSGQEFSHNRGPWPQPRDFESNDPQHAEQFNPNYSDDPNSYGFYDEYAEGDSNGGYDAPRRGREFEDREWNDQRGRGRGFQGRKDTGGHHPGRGRGGRGNFMSGHVPPLDYGHGGQGGFEESYHDFPDRFVTESADALPVGSDGGPPHGLPQEERRSFTPRCIKNADNLEQSDNTKSPPTAAGDKPIGKEEESEDVSEPAISSQASRSLAATLKLLADSGEPGSAASETEVKSSAPNDKNCNPTEETQKASQQNKDEDVDEEEVEDDEKSSAISMLPSRHSRGLMSTLISLAGPEVLNRKPDPLPPPQPMPTGATAEKTKVTDNTLFGEEKCEEQSYSELYCYLCRVETTSLHNFRDHLNGKQHKSAYSKVQMSLSEEDLLAAVPDVEEYENLQEYLDCGITRSMLQEAGIDVTQLIKDAQLDLKPSTSNKSSKADDELYCSVRLLSFV